MRDRDNARGDVARRAPAGMLTLVAWLAIAARAPAQAPMPVVPITPAGERLAQILDAMDVEHRWLPGEGVHWKTGLPDRASHQHATHCSAFAAAACDRMGIYLLRPPEHSQELLANAQFAWLEREGPARGWRAVGSRAEAQSLANDGWVVVCVLRNPDRHKPGHIAVARPSLRGAEDVERDGPDVAQAGRHNANATTARSGFRSHGDAFDAGQVRMFAHDSAVTRGGRASTEPDATPERPRAALVSRASNETTRTHRPLAEVLAANLPAWTGGTGVVEHRQLQALASDPRIRDDEAAALAALLHHFHKAPFHSLPTADLHAEGHDRLDHSYHAYTTKLDRLNRTLFAEGRPNFAKMQQGPAGDCYLFSGAGWWAYFRPERIVEMIRPTAEGRYFVRFPDGESAIVDPPTDTELAYNESGSTATDGIWMAVLEKAVGTIAAQHSEKARAIPDATLRVNLGGSAKVDVHRWTGRPVDTFHLHDRAQQAKVREALVRMQHRRLMAQAVVPRTEPPGPIPGNHVYAILGFDPATDVLTVWNPWGDNFTPKGPPGPQHGWPRKHGIFQIPLADFVRVFSTLDMERG